MKWPSWLAWIFPAAKKGAALGKKGYDAYQALPAEDKKALQENAKKLSERVLKK